MKTSICIGFFLLLACPFLNAKQLLYYYDGTKIHRDLNYSNINIWINGEDTASIMKYIASSSYRVKGVYQDGMNRYVSSDQADNLSKLFRVQLISNTASEQEGEYLLASLQERDDVQYASSSIIDNGIFSMLTNRIVVKMRREEDIETVIAYAKSTHTTFVGQLPSRPLWCVLMLDKGSASFADICSRLYESGKFDLVEPDMIPDFKATCATDPSFSVQWGLLNTGQVSSTTGNSGTSGVDIKVCDAWQSTTGSPSIVTAVLDEGVEATHEDLTGNMYGSGYDGQSNSTPQIVTGPHGTNCAGIIAARQNNGIGISGVAPTSKIMSTSIQYGYSSYIQFGNAVTYASDNGASVINISSGNTTTPTVHDYDNAIAYAFANGRGHLGCIVVASLGNDGTSSGGNYPATYDDNIIRVGAVNRCGHRSNISDACDPWTVSPGSDYGDKLDVVAPGTNVYTTDLTGSAGRTSTNYWSEFNGTSASAPFVAGIAALILSVNPCLTHTQVHDIICRTAQKINTTGSYTYSVNALHTLGLWNNELGYGLVNAGASVTAAVTSYLQNKNETSTRNYLNRYIRAGDHVTTFETAGTYKISSGANVTIRAKEEISLEDGFDADNFTDAYIETGNPSCNEWTPPFGNKESPTVEPQQLSGIKSTIGQGVTVYPSPFTNKVTIEYTLLQKEHVNISLSDIYGRVIFSKSAEKDKGSYSEEIADLSNLPSGIFVVSVCHQDDCKVTKIVKND